MYGFLFLISLYLNIGIHYIASREKNPNQMYQLCKKIIISNLTFLSHASYLHASPQTNYTKHKSPFLLKKKQRKKYFHDYTEEEMH